MTLPSLRHDPLTAEQRAIELAAYDRDQRALAGVEQLRFFPLAVTGGRGAQLTTASGRRLIDFSASWTASGAGHAHPTITEAVRGAIADQAGASVLSAATSHATALAERLIELVPVRGEKRRAYLGLAGTDANDVALRAARRASGRDGVLSFTGSYHGGLGLSQRVSGIGIAAGEDAPEAELLPFPTTADALAAVLAEAEERLSAGRIGAVIVEAVQCDGGVLVPADGFLRGLREACDRHGALLIVDEVKAGLGRTGPRFAFEHEGIEPDAVTLGKALGGGLPVSAVVASAELLDAPVASALLTTAGNPVACAAALAGLEVLASPERAEAVDALGAEFRRLVEEYRASERPGAARLAECRGRGLLHGLELVDPDGRADDDLAAKAIYRAWELGCVAYLVRGNVIECTPPLIISAEELRVGTERLLQAIDDAATGAVPDEALADFAGW